ncbi:hypothetical protein COLO4_08954 [Corchorus olitorius]|uniref:BRCT domain-containing protein n=1 Tax=Corchorus olitorius TaxID=93759 RepID=A0A1R3KDW8_9ROSI|nr:hypothetical protein COLO4_08954 [Corchorus olitorius]
MRSFVLRVSTFIFPFSCIVRSAEFGSECPICKAQCANRDLRPVTFMENIVGIYRSLDAAFSANLSQRVEDAVGKNEIVHGCSVLGHGKDKGYESPDKGRLEYGSAAGQIDLLRPISQKQGSGSEQMEINQVDQTSLGSPPSSGDAKGSDNDCSYQVSDPTPGSYPAKGLGKRNFDDRTCQEKQDDSVVGGDGHLWDSKRQKRLNYDRPLDMGVKTPLQSQNLLTTNCQYGASVAGADLHVTTDGIYVNRAICGFCQSSSISEATGPMLHYSKGKPVTGDAAFSSNVIHVHSSCIEWAPQVYFEDECVKNLKQELARGAKLKCSKCGQKGAALGCYLKSCRKSYHYPCAKEIQKCRWDLDNFLLLCPAHASAKFPNEKSGNSQSSGKFTTGNAQPMVEVPNKKSENCMSIDHSLHLHAFFFKELGQPKFNPFWGQPDEKKEWVFCGSALSSEEKFLLVKFAKSIGVTVSKFWKSDVTHVIASTDENGACTRTLKVLMAISNGKWVLKMDWIKACMQAMHPVHEEPYEISLDNHGCCDGPKTGRLRALDYAPKLFDGLSFYFVGDFVAGYKEDLQNLVVAAGGAVTRRMDELAEQIIDPAVKTKIMVVYNLDAPKGSELAEEVTILWQRLNEAQDLATKVGGHVIGHTWLLESIAAYKLQPSVS